MDAVNTGLGFEEARPPRGLAGLLLTFRIALRDLRAGTRGFGIFLACLAIVEPVLLARLGLAPGAELRIGNARFALDAKLVAEPDTLAAGIGLGPRLLISQEALRATGLLQPGSLVRWTYRVVLPQGANDD